MALAFVLSFLPGQAMSTRPLVRHGPGFGQALRLVLAVHTLSTPTVEVVDNLVMLVVPGAMAAGLLDWLCSTGSAGRRWWPRWQWGSSLPSR